MIATIQNFVCVSNPWTKIHNLLKPIGLTMGSFALGMWVQSAHDGAASIPWLQYRAEVAHKLETKTVPALKDVAGCQTERADMAMGEKASPNGIPDCPTLPKAVPPAFSPVPKQ